MNKIKFCCQNYLNFIYNNESIQSKFLEFLTAQFATIILKRIRQSWKKIKTRDHHQARLPANISKANHCINLYIILCHGFFPGNRARQRSQKMAYILYSPNCNVTSYVFRFFRKLRSVPVPKNSRIRVNLIPSLPKTRSCE